MGPIRSRVTSKYFAKPSAPPLPTTHTSQAAANEMKKPVVCQPQKKTKATTVGLLKLGFAPLVHDTVEPHTLILGTCPSDAAILCGQYFGNRANTFWDIVGKQCGFKRAATSYAEQVLALTSHGYAVWDVLASRKGQGSLDSKTVRGSDVPNDIRTLLSQRLVTVRRVCINSKSSAAFFLKHNRSWLGELGVWDLVNQAARDVFGAAVNKQRPNQNHFGEKTRAAAVATAPLQLAVMESTSPANAPSRRARLAEGITIDEHNKTASIIEYKRRRWAADCFTPPAHHAKNDASRHTRVGLGVGGSSGCSSQC
eukprot:m.77100 g.77100  ORF g.77100 m.77100 type:complete len:311 (-) comp14536_c0_seq1:640-1572(-)